jgi:hypothetical protein
MHTALELSIRDAVIVATPELALTDLRAFAHKVSKEMADGYEDERGYCGHVFEAVLDTLGGHTLEADEVADFLVSERRIFDYSDWYREHLMDLEDGWDDDGGR